jgi:hypothetical protein
VAGVMEGPSSRLREIDPGGADSLNRTDDLPLTSGQVTVFRYVDCVSGNSLKSL